MAHDENARYPLEVIGAHARHMGRALLLGAFACAPALALVGCGADGRTRGVVTAQPVASGHRPAASRLPRGSEYTLMQMNLCLSGLAACYRKVAYPAVVQEAVSKIREARPDAVTFNEACANDVSAIARRTGYRVRFSSVSYGRGPLECIRPGGRGVFGDAVLTRTAIVSSDHRAFASQTDIEHRQWLCVTTQTGIDVCTAHLSERIPIEVVANNGQCAELAVLLARRAATRTVIFGGDLNRRSPCAPAGFWTRTDTAAGQNPGLQQVYGTGVLRSPSAEVLPARHTDHDVLVVHAQVA